MEGNKIFCVLIDSDNVSHKYVKGILDEVSKYGVAQIKRLYGDLTDQSKKNWKEVSLEYSITPIQQYTYTNGKSATDSSMIIGAMDLLYTKEIDGFVIVSSDSDFTGLASRLREENKTVIGMGERKTPKPFIKACSEFKYLENFLEIPEEIKESVATTDMKELKSVIIEILSEFDTPIDISVLTNSIMKKQTDFDCRNYGYTKMSSLLDSMKEFYLFKSEYGYEISLSEFDRSNQKMKREEIGELLVSIVTESKNHTMSLGDLNTKLLKKCPEFNLKSFDFTRFNLFVSSFASLEVNDTKVSLK